VHRSIKYIGAAINMVLPNFLVFPAFRVVPAFRWFWTVFRIQILSGQWIRILNPDPEPGGQKLPTKIDKNIKKFHVLKRWMFSFF
jgi:hypothetical protein